MALAEQDFIIDAAFKEGIWRVGIDPPITFASGKEANNKVDWEGLFSFPEDPSNLNAGINFELSAAGSLVAGVLLEVVDQYAPDAVGGVPTGGQRYGRWVARELGIPFIRTEKDTNEPGIKTYRFADETERAKAMDSRRLAVIEDATTEFTSLVGYLALILETPGEREVGIRAIQRRDDGANELELPEAVDIEWLIELAMPNMMTAEHPAFRRWGHLAVGTFKPEVAALRAES